MTHEQALALARFCGTGVTEPHLRGEQHVAPWVLHAIRTAAVHTPQAQQDALGRMGVLLGLVREAAAVLDTMLYSEVSPDRVASNAASFEALLGRMKRAIADIEAANAAACRGAR